MQITIGVTGATLVRTGLEDLANEIPKIGRDQIYRSIIAARDEIKTYPPERPGQRYVRTYRLQAGWVVTAHGSIGYRLQNDVPYTIVVVGNAYGQGQAEVHAGTWKLVRDVTDNHVRTLKDDIQDHIRMVIRRNNLE